MTTSITFSLTYLSSAVRCFPQDSLKDLLLASRRNNARNEITGMLLYKDAAFMQVIEGEETSVRALYTTIEADSRHRHLMVVATEHAKQRQFSGWSMGFCNMESDFVKPVGFSEFLDSPLTGTEFSGKPARAEKLLLLFKTQM